MCYQSIRIDVSDMVALSKSIYLKTLFAFNIFQALCIEKILDTEVMLKAVYLMLKAVNLAPGAKRPIASNGNQFLY